MPDTSVDTLMATYFTELKRHYRFEAEFYIETLNKALRTCDSDLIINTDGDVEGNPRISVSYSMQVYGEPRARIYDELKASDKPWYINLEHLESTRALVLQIEDQMYSAGWKFARASVYLEDLEGENAADGIPREMKIILSGVWMPKVGTR